MYRFCYRVWKPSIYLKFPENPPSLLFSLSYLTVRLLVRHTRTATKKVNTRKFNQSPILWLFNFLSSFFFSYFSVDVGVYLPRQWRLNCLFFSSRITFRRGFLVKVYISFESEWKKIKLFSFYYSFRQILGVSNFWRGRLTDWLTIWYLRLRHKFWVLRKKDEMAPFKKLFFF